MWTHFKNSLTEVLLPSVAAKSHDKEKDGDWLRLFIMLDYICMCNNMQVEFSKLVNRLWENTILFDHAISKRNKWKHKQLADIREKTRQNSKRVMCNW